jgi:hypothetical protein
MTTLGVIAIVMAVWLAVSVVCGLIFGAWRWFEQRAAEHDERHSPSERGLW